MHYKRYESLYFWAKLPMGFCLNKCSSGSVVFEIALKVLKKDGKYLLISTFLYSQHAKLRPRKKCSVVLSYWPISKNKIKNYGRITQTMFVRLGFEWKKGGKCIQIFYFYVLKKVNKKNLTNWPMQIFKNST